MNNNFIMPIRKRSFLKDRALPGQVNLSISSIKNDYILTTLQRRDVPVKNPGAVYGGNMGPTKSILLINRDILLVVLIVVVLILSGCATVPLTGRSQLNLISEPTLLKMSVDSYRQVLRESRLSDNRKDVSRVNRVGRRVAQAAEAFLADSGLASEIGNYQWEFSLIDDDDMVNAWCMPGGKIAVYTGMLPISKNDAGLAVVISHEVAHALAKHGNERMSQQLLAQMGGAALSVALTRQPAATRNLFLNAYGVGVQVGFLLPYSRKHEYEADRIGLTIMALAGYDPHEALPFWQRMIKASDRGDPPVFLTTHPAPPDRIREIQLYIPEAMSNFRAAK
jgi:predicted Zn-dependent protease